MDFGAGEISHRKLSLTVQLSDPNDYEGGKLQFMIDRHVDDAPAQRGTVIVFPLFVMHRVTPVERGVRRSIVGWVSGLPYR
jgi:PKHD-type hydroxylase